MESILWAKTKESKGGTAFPICEVMYFLSPLKSNQSGNDCIRAPSLGVRALFWE